MLNRTAKAGLDENRSGPELFGAIYARFSLCNRPPTLKRSLV